MDKRCASTEPTRRKMYTVLLPPFAVLSWVNGEFNFEMMKLWVASDLPARLDVADVAKKLGIAVSDVPVLIGAGLLKPLGNPAANAPKVFATTEVLVLACDVKWLNKATKACADYWKKKRLRQTAGGEAVPKMEEAVAGAK